MKHIKLFDAFNTPINYSHEGKLPFSELYEDDILTSLIDEVDSGEIKMKFLNSFTNIPLSPGLRLTRVLNLYNIDNINPNADSILIQMELKHPQMIRNASFDYSNYAKQLLIHYFKRIFNNYDVNVFFKFFNLSYLDEYFCKVTVIIQENLHDIRFNQIVKESKKEIEEIEDYFLELSDHKSDDLPIKVEITEHKVNKSKGEIGGFDRVSKFKSIPGYKICIIFDHYDQIYVKKKTDLAINRLEREYNIHYNQISKRGNGNTFREIPVHGTNKMSYVSDPLWKQTITISPKNINESIKTDYLDNIEDFIDIVLENEIIKYEKTTFNLNRRKCRSFNLIRFENLIFGQLPEKLELYFNPVAEFNALLVNIDIINDNRNRLGYECILEKFKRITIRYPHILIFANEWDPSPSYSNFLHRFKLVMLMNPLYEYQVESNTNFKSESNLIIVDVQPSFKNFFTDNYVNQLKKYAEKYTNVYQIWDNHYQGHNVDKDYLYDKNPGIPNANLYTFPNQRDIIEKRYNYDVDADFYKKILDGKIYNEVKEKEDKGLLVRGNIFPTNEGTIIVYIGNKHVWYHCPKKLYELFLNLKGKEVIMVGGSDQECFLDIETTAKALGVIIKRNFGYIYSATTCPIK